GLRRRQPVGLELQRLALREWIELVAIQREERVGDVAVGVELRGLRELLVEAVVFLQRAQGFVLRGVLPAPGGGQGPTAEKPTVCFDVVERYIAFENRLAVQRETATQPTLVHACRRLAGQRRSRRHGGAIATKDHPPGEEVVDGDDRISAGLVGRKV